MEKLKPKFSETNEINNMYKEIKYDDGRYVGQFINGKREG